MKKPRIPIVARILGLNALLVFMPVASFLSLDSYEKSLLEALEGSLVQQGRVLAAWLGEGELTAERARAVLASLDKRHTARLRVIDSSGALLADSSSFERASPPESKSEPPNRYSGGAVSEASLPGTDNADPAENNWVYRLFSLPVRLYRRCVSPPAEPLDSADFYTERHDFLEGQEVRTALEGRYGAATRISAGGQVSVTLYSALPVGNPAGEVHGVVLASQSTFRILASLYRLRLETGKIFLLSLAASSALSLLLWLTISRPLKRLGVQARSALSLRGLAAGHFSQGAVSDEIGDLALALREFSSRLGERLSWAEAFAADLAHEIRNPLASIRAAAELLDGASPAEGRELATRITRDVDRANRVVGGLRELSRIESEDGEPGAADVLECVRNSVERARDSFAARAKRLVFFIKPETDGAPFTASIAPGRLGIALGAFLDNAVSFSPPGGDIEIKIDRSDEPERSYVSVSILDRGPGIPAEHLKRIFDRFFSFRPESLEPQDIAEHSSAPSEQSSEGHCGLGLSIAQGIARRALGRVEAANRPEGGARFSLILPEAPR